MMAEVGHVEVPVTFRYPSSTDVGFDGELPVTADEVTEFIRRALPMERFGLTSEVTFAWSDEEPYVEVEHLGMTAEDVKVEFKDDTGVRVSDLYRAKRRYRLRKVTADDDAV